MKCSYCEKEATYYAYWAKECPRPVIHACDDHFDDMDIAARINGHNLAYYSPEFAVDNYRYSVIVEFTRKAA